jgi:hypothetical protein
VFLFDQGKNYVLEYCFSNPKAEEALPHLMNVDLYCAFK